MFGQPGTLLGVAGTDRTRYTQTGEVDIAYQVLGDGPVDLLLFTGAIIPIECMDEEPSMARFVRRLATFGRLIRFDQRGVGLSDRGSPSAAPTGRHWVEDAVAVLDAAGSQRAAVLAPYLSAAEGISAGGDPSRACVAPGHRERRGAPHDGPGLPLWPQPEIVCDNLVRSVVEPDAIEQGVDILTMVAPSAAGDPAFRAWFDRAGNLGATPVMAEAHWAEVFGNDVRPLLAQIRVPTLVLHRQEVTAPFLEVGHGRYLGKQIPGAKYVELPGADALYWVGDTGALLDEVEEFVTGVRGGPGAERVLATLLFTDIVGSTDRAAHLGDKRWRDLLDRHDQCVRTEIGRFRGREVNTVGDGFVATFDSPSRAIECALAIRETLKASDIEVRAGIHTGEIEVRGNDVAGMAVHIGARVSALAGPGEVLVSSTVKDSVVGSSVEFEERGEHELKGVPGKWRLFSVSG